MSEPLIDSSFYAMFAEKTAQRLELIRDQIERYRAREITFAELGGTTRLPLHDIVGEARLLDLFDLGQLAARLSKRLGSVSQDPSVPPPAPLSDAAAAHFMLCCRLLGQLAIAQATQESRAEAQRSAYIEALLALEQTTP